MTESLQRKLSLRYPIVMAPMFLISNEEMVVAAAEAGILGSVPSLNYRTHEEFRDALRNIRARTKGAFAVNLIVKWGGERLEQDMRACIDHGVNVLITSLGTPEAIVPMAHEAGVLVFHDVINLKHARKVDAMGVDGIIAVAYGAGGHAGHISPFVLHPYLRQNVRAPIIASGAIVTGQQVAAALALGAEMAYIGTRFIASTESPADPRYKQMILDSAPEDIEFTPEVSGVQANFFRQSMQEYRAALTEGKEVGRWKDVWSAGHGVGLIHDIRPIKQIVADIVTEYERTRVALPAFPPPVEG